MLARFFQSNPTARRLPIAFDSARLAADLANMEATWWHRHMGPYHDGGWEAISLWSPGGQMTNQTGRGGCFAATPALARCPYVQELLEGFSAARHRVRFMRLRPGGHIHRHSDPMHQISDHVVRLHVPVQTNPQVDFQVNDRRIVMSVGETWHVDVRFKHQVTNHGAADRVHLVMDLDRDAQLDLLLSRAEAAGHGRLTMYHAKYILPPGLIRRLGIGN